VLLRKAGWQQPWSLQLIFLLFLFRQSAQLPNSKVLQLCATQPDAVLAKAAPQSRLTAALFIATRFFVIFVSIKVHNYPIARYCSYAQLNLMLCWPSTAG